MTTKGYSGPGIGAGAGDTLVLAAKHGLRRDGTERAVFALHGHGATAYVWQSHVLGPGSLTRELAERGWVVVADDFGGTTPWASDTAMADADVVHTFATSTTTQFMTGCLPTVDLCGWSMGGLTALEYLRRNPAKIHRAVLFAPATRIAYFHDANAGYAAEIEAAYGGAAAWAANVPTHEPINHPEAFRDLGCPIRIYHGDADATVPLAHSQQFVDAVDDPDVTLHVVPGGTHTNLFGLVSADDVAEFLWGKVPA